jgi:glycosyltransferase involved in cell wall biosynthesis
MLLSIILPVYNVEEYIERCVISLEQQDIATNDFEIIIVNDGSPDNSRQVVETLMKRFSNILLINQENKGVSAARNEGIYRAAGQYLLFVDPDDYVLPHSLGPLLNKAILQDLDVLYLAFDILDAEGKLEWKTAYSDKEAMQFSGVEAYFAARGQQVRDPDRSWAMLYKRSLLQEFSIDYPRDVPYLEDGLFLAKVFCVAGQCGFNNTPFYQRTTRPGSATHSNLFYSERALNGFIKAALDIQTFRKKNSLLPPQQELVNHVIAKFILLPVTACVGAVDWKAYQKIKRSIVAAGFSQLELKGCRAVYYQYARYFNESKDWFFVYYSFQSILKSFKFQIAKIRKAVGIAR